MRRHKQTHMACGETRGLKTKVDACSAPEVLGITATSGNRCMQCTAGAAGKEPSPQQQARGGREEEAQEKTTREQRATLPVGHTRAARNTGGGAQARERAAFAIKHAAK